MFQLLLVIIYLALISLGLPDALLGSVWPSMYRELGASVPYAGIINMIVARGTMISSLFDNKLIRAFETGKVTVISVAMTAAALFGFSSSHSFIQLCLWTIPYGPGAGNVGAGLNNFVALHYKSRHMNWLHFLWGIDVTTGPYIIGLCLTRGFKWNSGYVVVGVIQIALVACLVLSLPLWRMRAEESNGQDDTHKRITLREGLRLPGAKAVLTASFCYCTPETTAGLWASSYMVLHKGIAPRTAAKWASFFCLGIILDRLVSGFVTDWTGDRNMVRCGQLTAFAGTVLLFLPASDGAVLAELVTMGLSYAPIYPGLLHETPDNSGVQYSQSVMDVQTVYAYMGPTFMLSLFRVVAERISVTLYPVYLVVFMVLVVGMTERMGRVQDGKVNGLTHAQLLQ